MEDVGIFYGHLVFFTVFCYILWAFGIVRGNFVYFPHFGILYQEKSGNPADGHFFVIPSSLKTTDKVLLLPKISECKLFDFLKLNF
jgi:hypothetical protein